ASECLGHGHHHQRGVSNVVVGQIEDHEDQQDHHGEYESQRACCTDLVLELSAPLDVNAFGQLNFLRDDALRLINETDNVAVSHVQRDIVHQAAVFAFDHRRAFDNLHVGQGA